MLRWNELGQRQYLVMRVGTGTVFNSQIIDMLFRAGCAPRPICEHTQTVINIIQSGLNSSSSNLSHKMAKIYLDHCVTVQILKRTPKAQNETLVG